VAAGVSVAAAAVVIAMLAVPGLVGTGHDTTSSTAAATPPSVARLRVALSSGNATDVARADANLLREARTIAGPEQSDAVAAHVEAIQFLRDHPSAAAAAELPPPSTAAPTNPAPPSTTIAPGRDLGPSPGTAPPDVGSPVPVPTTLSEGPPNVAIVAVAARLDGTFDVDFTVSGFTPDASGAPGTHSVRFSFDGGQAPTRWGGPSPWSFPLSAGLTYRQVCAHVADAAGVEDPSTGGCHDII